MVDNEGIDLARFRIEGSTIDIEALEARVDAAIEAKRGTRFSDEELERLRNEPLEPRLRREDLPRGLMEELSAVRGRLRPAQHPWPCLHGCGRSMVQGRGLQLFR